MRPPTSLWVLHSIALGTSACCLSCVDTDSSPQDIAAACVATLPAVPPWQSVVEVDADLRDEGTVICTGFAIAETLVLTAARCLALPVKVEPSALDDPASRLIGGATIEHMGDVDYADNCHDSTGGWALVEDGSFAARLSYVLDASAITVSWQRADQSMASSSVSRIVLPGADSRCWNTPAVLVLDHGLGWPSAVVNLQETSSLGDPVTLSGLHLSEPELTRHELQASVVDVTDETGDAMAPPRSYVLDQPICDFESGGPVVNDKTGAVIGIISSETDFTCGDPAAPTIAMRLAPFRRMLIDVAASASETLSVTPFTSLDEPMAQCSVPVD